MNENAPETLRAKITTKAHVYIKAVDVDVKLSEPVYAVNWFNTRALWLYNFYNLMASISVKNVDGYPFFKGRVRDVLAGDEELRRNVLLIVHYPSPHRFVQMMESGYFKLVSLFRIMAVKDFTFGFTHCTNPQDLERDNDKNKIYALHHYCADEEVTRKLEDIVAGHKVEIYYAGKISALVYSGDAGQAQEQIPCLMNGVLLLRADTSDQIKNLVHQEDYQAAIKQMKSSFIATMDRVL